MRNSKPTIILTSAEADELATCYARYYAAATAEGLNYSHSTYLRKREQLATALRALCGVRKGTGDAARVDDAMFDNAFGGPEGIVAALTLTDHNVVIDGAWLAAGSDHFAIRRTFDALAAVNV